MTAEIVQCGPQGALGDLAAAGILAARKPPEFPVKIGTVVWVDEYSVPPLVKIVETQFPMRYEDAAGTLAPGDKVLWVENGRASFVRGKMASTRKTVATPTSDWYYTGDAAADHPAIGFRFWQGNADPNGNALFDVGFDPADVLIAHATSPEYSTGSRQHPRPITITADRKARITGMKPGLFFKVMLLVKNDSPPAGTPTVRYLATGQNAETPLAHPMFAVAVLTGTLDARGERDQGLPVGIIKSRVMGVHARATVNGESVDVSRFGKLEYWDNPTPRAHPTGRIDGAGTARPELAGAPYSITFIYSTTLRHNNIGADLLVDTLGDEAIGQKAPFQLVRFEATIDSQGRARPTTGIGNVHKRATALFGVMTDGDTSVGAELYSESEDNWELADPRRKGTISGEQAAGIVFLLEGGDTAAPA